MGALAHGAVNVSGYSDHGDVHAGRYASRAPWAGFSSRCTFILDGGTGGVEWEAAAECRGL